LTISKPASAAVPTLFYSRLRLDLRHHDLEPPCRRDIERIHSLRDGRLFVRRSEGARLLAFAAESERASGASVLARHSRPPAPVETFQVTVEENVIEM
jgi:hypothetical protein